MARRPGSLDHLTSGPWTKSVGLFVVTLCLTNAMAQQDLPCSLSTGTSRESFTANELLPIGSVLGVLNINGDPSANGTIELRLSQDDAAIEIIPETKNVVLRKALDREGIDGPSEVNLQVYCRKRDSTELVYPIPLRVFVSDANDNSPEFVDIPDYLQINEMTQIGTVITQTPIRAVDRDQTGPLNIVQYSIEPGPYADHLGFTNPLKGILTLKRSLDFEEIQHFNITIKAQDLGNPPRSTTAVIPVHVLDADDLNPKFDDERYTSVIGEEPEVGTVLQMTPRPISAHDMDRGINAPLKYSFKSSKVDGKYFSIEEATGVVTLQNSLPDDIVFPLTLVIKASQTENLERSALTTLTISQRSTFLTGLHFLQKHYVATIPEIFPVNQTVITLQTNKLNNHHLLFSIINGSSKCFVVTHSGELKLKSPLDYDVIKVFSLIVSVSDGKLNDSTSVNVTVTDVNKHSPVFKSQLYNFVVLDGVLQVGLVLGQVEVEDGDVNDVVTLGLAGETASSFSIDEYGVIRVTNVSRLNSSLTHLIVTATDNGHPPLHSSVPVIVTVPDEIRLGSFQSFTAESSYLLMIIFGAVLGVLILVILVLSLYIAKQKSNSDFRLGRSSQHLSKMSAYMAGGMLHEKLLGSSGQGTLGVENPVFHNDTSPPSFHSDVSQANRSIASASTAPMKSKPRRHTHLECCAVIPTGKEGPSGEKLKDGQRPKGSKLCDSIPRRVKKLSWEDEKVNTTELDPEVSVTPLAAQSTSTENDAPTTTCYF